MLSVMLSVMRVSQMTSVMACVSQEPQILHKDIFKKSVFNREFRETFTDQSSVLLSLPSYAKIVVERSQIDDRLHSCRNQKFQRQV